MKDNARDLKANSKEFLDQSFELLGFMHTKAKALATVGVELEYESYDRLTLSDYWNTILNLIQQAEQIREHIVAVLDKQNGNREIKDEKKG